MSPQNRGSVTTENGGVSPREKGFCYNNASDDAAAVGKPKKTFVMCKSDSNSIRPLIIGIADICEQRVNDKRVSVGINYPQAVSLAGHIPVVIARCSSTSQLEKILSTIDILLLPGGEDIAPARYNESAIPETKAVNPERDDFDWRLLEAA